jgi:hypothetical protein
MVVLTAAEWFLRALQDLVAGRKVDPQKLAIAARLRKETTLPLKGRTTVFEQGSALLKWNLP